MSDIETEAEPVDAALMGGELFVPLDVAERDARKAASGGVSRFTWQCCKCMHIWGCGYPWVYADPAWCPQCTGAQPKA